MHIVGVDQSEGTEGDLAAVHTIEVWYSERRRAWIVERLDVSGHHVGLSHACGSRADAAACLAEWLRAHPETCLAAPVPEAVARLARRPATSRRPISASPRNPPRDRSSTTARVRPFGT